MVLLAVKTFYKAIVIKPDLFASAIVDEKHFPTMEQAQEFKEWVTSGSDGLLCIVRQMCQ